MTEHWQARISTMLESWPRLQSVSIHNNLVASGFDGSYPTVVRAVRNICEPRLRAVDSVSVPIQRSDVAGPIMSISVAELALYRDRGCRVFGGAFQTAVTSGHRAKPG